MRKGIKMPRLIRRNSAAVKIITKIKRIIKVVKKIVVKEAPPTTIPTITITPTITPTTPTITPAITPTITPTKRNPYKIEIFDDKSGKPRWRLVSTNGNILATSEAYERKTTRTRIASNLAKGLGLIGVEESDNNKLS